MDRDWKIGLGFSALLFALAFAAGEPVQAFEVDPFQHAGSDTMQRVPFDANGAQRLGSLVQDVTGMPCASAVTFEHAPTRFSFGFCDNDTRKAFAWAPDGNIVETGLFLDVVAYVLDVQIVDAELIDDRVIEFSFIQF